MKIRTLHDYRTSPPPTARAQRAYARENVERERSRAVTIEEIGATTTKKQRTQDRTQWVQFCADPFRASIQNHCQSNIHKYTCQTIIPRLTIELGLSHLTSTVL